MMENMGFDKYIELLQPICEGMHGFLGGKIEFVLHDLSKLESSVVLVEGNITNRQIGAPATNMVINAIEKYGDNAPDIIGYASTTKDGRALKSSTIFLRNFEGRIIGCFCCNIDLTEFQLISNTLKAITEITAVPVRDAQVGDNEVFAQSISEVVEDVINLEIKNYGKPVMIMNKTDKLNLMRSLEKKKIFEVKNSAEMMAGILNVSIYTIYNYLKEIRIDLERQQL